MTEIPVKVHYPIRQNDPKKFKGWMILQEEDGLRTCYMAIEEYTAHILVDAIEGNIPACNSPHDAFVEAVEKLNGEIKKIVVLKFERNLYKAVIHVEREGVLAEINSTPPDAVIVGLLKRCPILINENLLGYDKDINDALDSAYKTSKKVFN